MEKYKKLKWDELIWSFNLYLYSVLSGILTCLFAIDKITTFYYLLSCVIIGLMLGWLFKKYNESIIKRYKYETYRGD